MQRGAHDLNIFETQRNKISLTTYLLGTQKIYILLYKRHHFFRMRQLNNLLLISLQLDQGYYKGVNKQEKILLSKESSKHQCILLLLEVIQSLQQTSKCSNDYRALVRVVSSNCLDEAILGTILAALQHQPKNPLDYIALLEGVTHIMKTLLSFIVFLYLVFGSLKPFLDYMFLRSFIGIRNDNKINTITSKSFIERALTAITSTNNPSNVPSSGLSFTLWVFKYLTQFLPPLILPLYLQQQQSLSLQMIDLLVVVDLINIILEGVIYLYFRITTKCNQNNISIKQECLLQYSNFQSDNTRPVKIKAVHIETTKSQPEVMRVIRIELTSRVTENKRTLIYRLVISTPAIFASLPMASK
ncbi:UNKNOWN [Stylonychia lemnae]|uniref:Transmembrane protein n=1 Tax=Stylonychia lemnae TaxID=5949 RepID=A0A078AE88_STYLE|nr:UNKNOWN [Stylonychia lemnae]|eukprot:CDW79817.1 UNKNOWN [Stylonychia lemnae]